VGEGETQRFGAADDAAHLIVHFTRIQRGDSFVLRWVGPEGVVGSVEDIVSGGSWREYRFALGGRSPGRYAAEGVLNGVEAFRIEFLLSP
jgi:hypothetical protein